MRSNYKSLVTSLLLIISFVSFSQENCSNGIDDDSDGLIDLNDSDCSCNTGNISLVQNPSFEANSGCPTTYQQFSNVSSWVKGNSESIDYLNTCGFTRYTGVPFPTGNGVAGCFYLEDRLRYIGQCLPSPITSGTNYTLNFKVNALSIDNAGNMLDAMVGGLCGFNYNSIPYPVTIALYGTSNCSDLPWAGTGSPIGNGNWVLLGQVTYSPADTLWTDLSINFTPSTNIAAIAIGPPTTQISNFPIYAEGGNGNIGCFPYIEYDDILLNTANQVTDVEISKTGTYCGGNLILNATCNIPGGTWQWYRNGIALSGETSANLQVSTNNYGVGKYIARYFVNGNCYTEYSLLQLPTNIHTDFATGTSCMVNIVACTDLSFAGSFPIAAWSWDFGDGNTDTVQNPVHRYNTNGTFNIRLIITTNEGCKDTIIKPQVVNKPTPFDVTTCSCSGLGISLIPNHSFEDHSCCPTNYSQLNCADTWIQASDATSDYWNTCGSIQMDYNPPLPPPDGNGFAGYIDMGPSYKEYIGACLVQPMLAGKSYNLTFQMASTSAASFAFWGATSCADLPFPGMSCPQGVGTWDILTQQTIPLGGGTWHQVSMSLTLTQDIYAVLLGPDCGPGPGGIGYYYVDNLNLSSSFLQPVDIQGSYCSNDVILKSGPTSDTFNLEYQWFKNGIELVGETDTLLNVSANGYGIGDYQIMGVYRDGCDVSPKFHVDTAYIDFDTSTVLSCPNVQNGQILVSSITGVGNTAPYLFQLGNNTPTTDSTFINLIPGSYMVKVIDSKGCKDSALVILDSFPNATALFTADSACIGGSNIFTDNSTITSGSITNWDWNFGDSAPIGITQNTSHTYASAGTWNVKLVTTSDHGCKDSITHDVSVFALPTANAGSSQFVCEGESLTLAGSIGGTATSGKWTGGTGTFAPNDSTLNAVYTPSAAEYAADSVALALTTNDPIGPCSPSLSNVTFHFYKKPVINFAAVTPQGCPIHCTDFTNSSTVETGSTITTWDWSFGDGSENATSQTPSHCYTNPGYYDITLTATTNHSCSDTLTKPQHVHVFNVPIAAFTPEPYHATILDPSIIFSNQSSSDVTYWNWNFGDGTSTSPDTANPEHHYPEGVINSYTTTLIVHNADGCYDTTAQTVFVDPEFAFYIPNTFTPNGDGINDSFNGSGIGIIKYDLWIFDRWGNMIFHTLDLNDNWTGKANNGSDEAQIDVYVWKVKLTDIFKKQHNYIGTVNLLK